MISCGFRADNATEGADYTDFHILLKTDGKWQMIAKGFDKYEGRA